MSLQGVFHANHFQRQGNKEERTTKEICGLPLAKLSKSSSQNTLSWKTCQGFFQVDISKAFYQILHKSGMMQNGVIYRRRIVERHIREKEFGFLHIPTPTRSDVTAGESRMRGDYKRYRGEDLATYALRKAAWPTPSKSDWKDSKNDGFSPLGRAFKPHPTRRQGYNSQVTKNEMGGQLNPDWVEWLMGWPIGWDSLEPMTDLLWLDWSVDPADMESKITNWPTPNSEQMGNTPENFDSHIENRKQQGKSIYGASLAIEVQRSKYKNVGSIPRIAIGIKDRVDRLKAIGNGQVPVCIAKAWKILTN
ncbi:hypothetical protein LCGC14_1767840 [marine sediment metagenome]|uniref:Uncharacterized protein n=1 Tax=marine sediment metagenome TaxID=412755 RepID=A0A0F9GZ22_9ZZZZ